MGRITTLSGRRSRRCQPGWVCSRRRLRRWLRQAEVDAGNVDGVSTMAARELRELKRKNAELKRTIEILKAATSFFVRESDPQHR